MLRRLKLALGGIARKFGYDVIPSYLLDQVPLARHLQALFRRLDIDTVVDVGAHYGEYATFLREAVGYKGAILSVEPIRDNFSLLKQAHVSDPDWAGVNAALGPANGRMSINVTKDTQFASFKVPSQSGLAATGDAQMVVNAAIQGTEEVEVLRLDELLTQHCANRPNARIYLKLDTQGFDLQVIAGIGTWANRILAMQSEISMLPLYEGMPTYAESIKTYNDLGFEVTGLFPVSRDEKLRVIEFDCTMVSKGAS